MAANELPGFAFVWSNATGLRQVLDTGASYNDRVARRKGADHWLDFWSPTPCGAGFGCTAVLDVAAVRGRGPCRWKYGRRPQHVWLEWEE